MPTRPSRAAIEIADHLSLGGHQVTASLVHYWASRGLFGTTSQTWPGGGGSEVAYPADAREVAHVIVALPSGARNRRQVVLACFARGIDVELAELRSALAEEIADLRGAVRGSAGSDEEATDAVAEATAAALVGRRRRGPTLRLWSSNAAGWEVAGAEGPDRFKSNDERLTTLLFPLMSALLGDPSYLEGMMGGVLTAVAGTDAARLATASHDLQQGDLQHRTAKTFAIIIEGLEATAGTVEEDELLSARQILLGLGRAANDPTATELLEGPLVSLGSVGQVVAVSALALVVAARSKGFPLAMLARAIDAAVGSSGPSEG